MSTAILRSPKFALIASLLAVALIISGESLWTDEGCTALFAMQPDFAAWWGYLSRNTASDCQMPLSMFLAWVSGQIIGMGEWQMRAINALWAFLALGGMWRAGEILKCRALPAALAIQPYFWFYTNEARPYALQLACGAWLLVATLEFLFLEKASRRWAVTLTVASVVLCYATLLAPVTLAACAVVPLIWLLLRRQIPDRRCLLPLIAGVAVVVPVAVYYADTLARGARGSALWAVDLKSFAYVIYEMIGLTGLGPPVDQLREMAKSAGLAAMVTAHAGPFLLAGFAALALCLILLLGLRASSVSTDKSVLLALAAPLLVGTVLFFAASYVLKKPFWARHLAPLFPFYVAFVMIAARAALRGKHRTLTLFANSVLTLLLVVSCLNLRFSQQHRKEDYRTAAHEARKALSQGAKVWWFGSMLCAEYYDLPVAQGAETQAVAFYPQASDAADVLASQDASSAPAVIVINHREDADHGGQFALHLAESRYRPNRTIQGFTVWEK